MKQMREMAPTNKATREDDENFLLNSSSIDRCVGVNLSTSKWQSKFELEMEQRQQVAASTGLGNGENCIFGRRTLDSD